MKIKFHGYLKKLCPKEYEIHADTPAEAIRGLTNQLKQLRRIGGTRWTCKVRECPTKDSLYSHDDSITELNLYPQYAPSGGGMSNPWVSIAIGVVLIAATVITAGVAGMAAGSGLAGFLAAAGSASSYGMISMAFISMGAGMILTGVAQMLTPVPESESGEDTEQSKYFGSGKNTTAIGTPIPIGYGIYKVYGHLLSVNTQASNEA